mmetsp:Transcript_82518/g.260532  ORF Transcript_82518/g.260532 Transcript_82518/m.260532 type:complete len:171 (+) Transcript_82518:91-603(+)|eukprot:CAMPEP_0175441498 /NCGR_PEP_ID=MMETSP0095-20121207/57631_1 /TAXON_ID=311494 /ORGANISM="Alexandrium monilatum, Strain CCMP3105" /LENGTH=170 /DNA_ID=CAMNT_0016741433 /DNA_START=37 /DNA_END=549 /DNA_ORIENTATION=+
MAGTKTSPGGKSLKAVALCALRSQGQQGTGTSSPSTAPAPAAAVQGAVGAGSKRETEKAPRKERKSGEARRSSAGSQREAADAAASGSERPPVEPDFDELAGIFAPFDPEATGRIRVSQFIRIILAMGDGLTEEELRAALEAHHDGVVPPSTEDGDWVNYRDFTAWALQK